MFNELDVVRLKCDLPEENLAADAKGTVHQVYPGAPNSYLVEFSDAEGITFALLTLSEDMLEVVWTAQGGKHDDPGNRN